MSSKMDRPISAWMTGSPSSTVGNAGSWSAFTTPSMARSASSRCAPSLAASVTTTIESLPSSETMAPL